MKNLKHFFLASFVLSSLFLFISCSSDDDNPTTAPSIFGTWKYIGYVEDGEYFDDADACESQLLTINIDNTGTMEINDCDFGNQSADITWEHITGNKYNVTALGNTTSVFLTFPSGNDIMHITVEGDPTYSEVMKRQ